MNHYFALAAALLFSLGSHAQEKSPKGSSVGIQFSSDYTYRFLHQNDPYYKNFIKESRNTIESGSFGYTTGISYQYTFKNRLFIQTGVQISKKTIHRNDSPALPDKTYEITNTFFISGLHNSPYNKYERTSLEVPVSIGQTFYSNKRISLFATFGLSINLLTELSLRDTKPEFIQDDIKETQDHTRWMNLNASASIGVDVKLIDRLTLRIEPNYRQAISPIRDWKNPPFSVKEFPFSAGLNTGLFYHFK